MEGDNYGAHAEKPAGRAQCDALRGRLECCIFGDLGPRRTRVSPSMCSCDATQPHTQSSGGSSSNHSSSSSAAKKVELRPIRGDVESAAAADRLAHHRLARRRRAPRRRAHRRRAHRRHYHRRARRRRAHRHRPHRRRYRRRARRRRARRRLSTSLAVSALASTLTASLAISAQLSALATTDPPPSRFCAPQACSLSVVVAYPAGVRPSGQQLTSCANGSPGLSRCRLVNRLLPCRVALSAPRAEPRIGEGDPCESHQVASGDPYT